MWTDRNTIHRAIIDTVADLGAHLIRSAEPGGPTPGVTVTVIHGGARGADQLAGDLARRAGFTVEPHPADWVARGRAAGPIRNQAMVDAGADICLAFPIGPSPGTRDCARRAAAAGIPVHTHEGTPP